MDQNRVVIIGGDHHNTLAAIRCFGENHCPIHVLLHDRLPAFSSPRCIHSRFVRGQYSIVAETEEAIVQWLLRNASEKTQVLFPCSDLAAYAIDKHSKQLACHYLFPGFYGYPGQMTRMMNKWEQYLFALKYQIPMAKTWILSKQSGHFTIPSSLPYPCILKPAVSASGNKLDIVKVQTEPELIAYLKSLEEKYDILLIQEFLNYAVQLDSCGTILKSSGQIIGCLFDKLRESRTGSTSYGVLSQNSQAIALNQSILHTLSQMGYHGQYDLEFFLCDGKLYLNEINFRHSGSGAFLLDYKIYAPYDWYLDILGRTQEIRNGSLPSKAAVHSDLDDIFNVRMHRISPIRWMHDFLHTPAHMVFHWNDLPGTLAFYWQLFKRRLCRK